MRQAAIAVRQAGDNGSGCSIDLPITAVQHRLPANLRGTGLNGFAHRHCARDRQQRAIPPRSRDAAPNTRAAPIAMVFKFFVRCRLHRRLQGELGAQCQLRPPRACRSRSARWQHPVPTCSMGCRLRSVQARINAMAGTPAPSICNLIGTDARAETCSPAMLSSVQAMSLNLSPQCRSHLEQQRQRRGSATHRLTSPSRAKYFQAVTGSLRAPSSARTRNHPPRFSSAGASDRQRNECRHRHRRRRPSLNIWSRWCPERRRRRRWSAPAAATIVSSGPPGHPASSTATSWTRGRGEKVIDVFCVAASRPRFPRPSPPQFMGLVNSEVAFQSAA